MRPIHRLQPIDKLDAEAWESLGKVVHRYEADWHPMKSLELREAVSRCRPGLRTHALLELIRVDQEFSWRCGFDRTVEYYVDHFKEVAVRDELLLELITAECLTRSIYSKTPRYQELQTRFPAVCQHIPLASIRQEAEAEGGFNRSTSTADAFADSSHSADRFSRLVGTEFHRWRLNSLLSRDYNCADYSASLLRADTREVRLSLTTVDSRSAELSLALLRRSCLLHDHSSPNDVGVFENYIYRVGLLRQSDNPTRRSHRPMSLLQDNQVIRDTYEVERHLGEGAFAEVYRVRHRFLGRQAMKVFKIVGMTIEETEEMLGEALLLSRIGHPNIVRVFDANTTETSRGICGFFTMEYVAGGSLDKFWKSFGAQFVPVTTAVDVISQVCRGLAVAHRETPPMVHRDIKPQNILVGYEADGLRARLSDFGLARNVNPLTLLASAKGTPSFKAPEVFTDPQSDSCAGDVWSVGATLYLLLTDRLPFAAEHGSEQFDLKRFKRKLVSPSVLNSQVDAQLEAVLLKALAKDPTQRYQNADEILEALSTWTPSTTDTRVESTVIWSSSKNALGKPTSANESEARAMAEQALKLAMHPVNLIEAADLMEEAFNRWPDLRSDYETQLKLWRRGISM